MAKLGGRDESVAIAVEDLEGLDQLLLGVGVLHLARHEAQELREIDSTVAIRIDLIDHVLQLSLSGVLAQRAHHRAKLLGRNGAIAILVEEREGLLELSNLLLGELVRHYDLRKVCERVDAEASAGTP